MPALSSAHLEGHRALSFALQLFFVMTLLRRYEKPYIRLLRTEKCLTHINMLRISLSIHAGRLLLVDVRHGIRRGASRAQLCFYEAALR